MIETRDGKLKSIVGFHNTGVGTAFTKAEGTSSPAARQAHQAMDAVGSASEMMKKKYEHMVLRQPDKGFSFKCEGDWKGANNVQWKAQYSKSLEYIMFPSLSLMNNSGDLQLNVAKDKSSHPTSSNLATFYKFTTEQGLGASVDADINWKVK
jgi:hypothetical protein